MSFTTYLPFINCFKQRVYADDTRKNHTGWKYMPVDEPLFTIGLGLAVMLLATLLVRSQLIPSSIIRYGSQPGTSRGQAGKLLVPGSIAASILALCTVLWELLGR